VGTNEYNVTLRAQQPFRTSVEGIEQVPVGSTKSLIGFVDEPIIAISRQAMMTPARWRRVEELYDVLSRRTRAISPGGVRRIRLGKNESAERHWKVLTSHQH
jgi:hypothetical protein